MKIVGNAAKFIIDSIQLLKNNGNDKSDFPHKNIKINKKDPKSLYNCKPRHQRFANCDRALRIESLYRMVKDISELLFATSIIKILVLGNESSITGRKMLKQKVSSSMQRGWILSEPKFHRNKNIKNHVPTSVVVKGFHTVRSTIYGRTLKAAMAGWGDGESARGSNTMFQDQAQVQVQKGVILRVSPPIQKPLSSQETPSDYKYLNYSRCSSKIHRDDTIK